MAPPDLSLHTALSHLLAHLTDPLASSLPPATLTLLRSHLRSLLTLLFAPSWHPSEPSRGSAFRSLIGRQGRLPKALRQAAANAAVDLALWERSLADACDGQTEWQAWCDPGRVQWRNGGWEWEDGTWFFGGWKGSSIYPIVGRPVLLPPPAFLGRRPSLNPPCLPPLLCLTSSPLSDAPRLHPTRPAISPVASAR